MVNLLLLALLLGACDTTEPPSQVAGSAEAALNGAPWSATARYVEGNGRGAIEITSFDPATSVSTTLTIDGPAAAFTDEALRTLGPLDGAGDFGTFVFELQGDAVVQSFAPQSGALGTLRVTAVDEGVLRATFEVTAIAEFPPNEPFQTLPDTLRFTAGTLEVSLDAQD